QIKIQVGVASDVNAHDPEQSMDFPCFNFEGEALPMQGFSDVDSDLIEIGLDITPLINYIPANGVAKIFLDVIQKSTETPGTGRIESFSVMDYTDGTHEFANTDGRVAIQPNSVNRLTVPIGITVNKPVILNEELPIADAGLAYRAQLEADGTTGPYRYSNPATWFVETPVEPSAGFTGGTDLFPTRNFTSTVVELPFAFPLYGKSYDQVTIMADGGIVMGPEVITYPYVIFPCYRFYQNCGIYPFFSTLHYTLASQKVTMESSSNQVVIRWKACVDLGGNQPVEFAAVLKPDGTIRCEYGEMDVTADISWISGVSKGDNLEYHLMDNYLSGIKDNSAFTLSLLNWPSWLSLGTNGDMSGTPEKSGTYVLPLKVTDWLGISNNKELSLKVNGGSGVVTDPEVAGVQVWPNPVSHEIWIDGYATANGNLTITIFDLSGRQLFSRDFRAQAGRNTFHCNDFESLTNGIYLFKLSGVITAQGKLLKQN
ncbi:MAG: T9SS type A sorting domain-containing protein, partial [Bacteroidales bacterium]|nr:T9SS type A sorting domain-containing protein [Bacteroidales bacterium]